MKFIEQTSLLAINSALAGDDNQLTGAINAEIIACYSPLQIISALKVRGRADVVEPVVVGISTEFYWWDQTRVEISFQWNVQI